MVCSRSNVEFSLKLEHCQSAPLYAPVSFEHHALALCGLVWRNKSLRQMASALDALALLRFFPFPLLCTGRLTSKIPILNNSTTLPFCTHTLHTTQSWPTGNSNDLVSPVKGKAAVGPSSRCLPSRPGNPLLLVRLLLPPPPPLLLLPRAWRERWPVG